MDEEVDDAVCTNLGIGDSLHRIFRRNVITSRLTLNDLIGQTFEVQGVQFFGREESRPCYWMDRAFGPGAETALKGNGGLRASIVRNGVLRRTEQRMRNEECGMRKGGAAA